MDTYRPSIRLEDVEPPSPSNAFLAPAWFIACGVGAILGGFFLRGTPFSWPMMMLGAGAALVGSVLLYRGVARSRLRAPASLPPTGTSSSRIPVGAGTTAGPIAMADVVIVRQPFVDLESAAGAGAGAGDHNRRRSHLTRQLGTATAPATAGAPAAAAAAARAGGQAGGRGRSSPPPVYVVMLLLAKEDPGTEGCEGEGPRAAEQQQQQQRQQRPPAQDSGSACRAACPPGEDGADGTCGAPPCCGASSQEGPTPGPTDPRDHDGDRAAPDGGSGVRPGGGGGGGGGGPGGGLDGYSGAAPPPRCSPGGSQPGSPSSGTGTPPGTSTPPATRWNATAGAGGGGSGDGGDGGGGSGGSGSAGSSDAGTCGGSAGSSEAGGGGGWWTSLWGGGGGGAIVLGVPVSVPAAAAAAGSGASGSGASGSGSSGWCSSCRAVRGALSGPQAAKPGAPCPCACPGCACGVGVRGGAGGSGGAGGGGAMTGGVVGGTVLVLQPHPQLLGYSMQVTRQEQKQPIPPTPPPPPPPPPLQPALPPGATRSLRVRTPPSSSLSSSRLEGTETTLPPLTPRPVRTDMLGPLPLPALPALP